MDIFNFYRNHIIAIFIINYIFLIKKNTLQTIVITIIIKSLPRHSLLSYCFGSTTFLTLLPVFSLASLALAIFLSSFLFKFFGSYGQSYLLLSLVKLAKLLPTSLELTHTELGRLLRR